MDFFNYFLISFVPERGATSVIALSRLNSETQFAIVACEGKLIMHFINFVYIFLALSFSKERIRFYS